MRRLYFRRMQFTPASTNSQKWLAIVFARILARDLRFLITRLQLESDGASYS